MRDDLENERAEHIKSLAIDRYRNDARFRALAMSTVSRAMHDHGRVDPYKADRDACDIATTACVVLLETIFQEDAELNAMRRERDEYKKIAERALALSPIPPIFLTKEITADSK